MHSSLLPRHRGPNPFTAVLAQGESESGVTFHVMEPSIDTGAILDQTPFPITDKDTMFSVYKTACRIASERAVAVMDQVEAKGLEGRPQDPAHASYDKKPVGEDALIDWSRSAAEIQRLVRAYAPNVLPRFQHRGKTVYLAQAAVGEGETAEPPGTVLTARRAMMVATGDGVLQMRVMFTRTPMPWVWPAPWNRPAKGDRLDNG